ncbi:hypothetical protein [Leifsonia sp. EB34]|uniref:hypothetical protein n=1 Tax=Leifsonia sp. EB34 TaxID=3156303 RepID=UPI003515128C
MTRRIIRGAAVATGAAFAAALLAATPAVADQNTNPDFGPNVFIADPSMSDATIAAALNSINQEAQFSDNRHAVLFTPGTYGQSSVATGGLNAQVGYYTSIAGLGASPDDVNIVGGLQAEGQLSGPTSDNATTNFWRSLENLSIKPLAPGKNNDTSRALHWAVSQAAPLRRVDVQGNLQLFPTYGGYSSGGFLANTRVTGVNGVNAKTSSGSQQQWYSRDSDLGTWSGSVWNMVFSGVTGAPADSPATGTPPKTNFTTLPQTPVTREKPYLYIDATGSYRVFVPGVAHNTSGVDWTQGNGVSLPLSDFYIAKPSDTADSIDAQLAAGKHLVLTPGIYDLDHSLHVTRPDTVVYGMGFATLRPQNGASAIQVSDVDGVSISGILVDAGTTPSANLIQVGDAGATAAQRAGHSADPTWLSDVFFRVGGAVPGSATTSLEVDSNDVLLDDIWAWRADHGNGVGWTQNTADYGVVVNGDDVVALGLAVEHYQKEQVLWNGEGGTTIFYQSEEPYDVPDQASWMDGASNGYASYRVADDVVTHHAYGLGV